MPLQHAPGSVLADEKALSSLNLWFVSAGDCSMKDHVTRLFIVSVFNICVFGFEFTQNCLFLCPFAFVICSLTYCETLKLLFLLLAE